MIWRNKGYQVAVWPHPEYMKRYQSRIRHCGAMQLLGIDFFTGVPDSLLSPLCDTLYL